MRVAFALLVSLISQVAFGQELPKSTAPEQLPPNGTEILRGLLDVNGIEPWKPNGFRTPNLRAEQILVIVYGEPIARHSEIQSMVQNYSSIIALRGPFPLGNLISGSTDSITGMGYVATDSNVTPTTLPEDQRKNCPFVVTRSGLPGPSRVFSGLANEANHPLQNFGKVATLRPTTILMDPTTREPGNRNRFGAEFKPIAWLPGSVSQENRPRAKPGRNEAFAMLARLDDVAPVPRGQLEAFNRTTLVMADEHPFSNQLLALDGTDNLAFAMSLIKDAKADGVTHCLFYEYGEPVTKFDDVKFKITPITPPIPFPPPHIADMIATQVADQAVDQLDKTNALNNFFRDRPRWLGRFIAFMLGLILAYMTWRVIRGVWSRRHRPEQLPMPTHPFSKLKTAAGLVGQLQRDVIVSGDYGPVVRDYLKEMFQSLGLKNPTPTPQPPPIRYDGKPEHAQLMFADFFHIWTKVYISEDRLPLATWKTIEPRLLKIWKSARAGRWRFAEAMPPAKA